MGGKTNTSLDRWASEMRLGALVGRKAKHTPQTRAIATFVHQEAHPDRFGRMIIGLYLAFIAVAEGVLGAAGKTHSSNALREFKRVEVDAKGRRTKTLTFQLVNIAGKKSRVGIRGAYEDVQKVVRGKLRRFDYPSSGPHSTQEWVNHQDRLRAIFAMSPEERRGLAEDLWKAIVDLPEHARRTVPRSGVAPFVEVLRDFHPKGSGIPSGAVLQGLTYGYMRADAPTLNFRTAKVRAGGKREGRVGDIDGYHGADVAQAAEVKDFVIDDFDVLDDFLRNLGEWPDAVAFVVCAGATDDVRQQAGANNVTIITVAEMIDAVRLWPISKQMDGVRAAMEYFVHIEQKDALIRAYEQFLTTRRIDLSKT